MHTANYLRRFLGLMSIVLLLGSTMACNKMLAEHTLEKARERVEEAKKNQAAENVKNLLDETNAAINQGTNKVNAEQFAEARTTAKEASRLSKKLLEDAKEMYADDLKKAASLWISRADLNQGPQINRVIYDQIIANNDKGLQLSEKQKWDKTIETFSKVIEDVNYLLNNLETEAKNGLAQTRQMNEELVAEGADVHAPDFVEQLKDEIQQIQVLIENDYNYRQAISMRDQARQTKEQGIQRTKDVKSNKMLLEIENLLDEATKLGADIYALQNFNVITKDFENLLKQYYEKNFDTVLASAPDLKPRVDDLIVETKRESARSKMNAVEQSIATLTDGKARAYLPGRVEELDTLLASANDLFGQNQYTESEKISLRGLELKDRIVEEFNTLTQTEINKASDQLAQAESVYNRMQEIFDARIIGDWKGDDKALEDAKQALKSELNARLNNSRRNLGLSSLKREEQEFDTAIVTARGVVSEADFVTQQTYRVVAHNAILEISNAISRYERDGGRQYAAAELDKTAVMLEQSRSLLGEDKFREAVRRASETKAQHEIMVQELTRVAERRIEQAQATLATAKDKRAETYENESFTRAFVSLDQARTALDGEGLRQAIESADEASSIARDATTKALKKWSLEEMLHADKLIARASEAGATEYAPDELQQAEDLRDNLQKLFDQANYDEAIQIGQLTIEAAEQALYSRVIEAERQIARSQRYHGWEFEAEKLTNAIVSAKNARESLDKGQYILARQHAEQAIATASKVTNNAKFKSFNNRMDSLNKSLDEAKHQGTGYYQIGDVARIMSEMNSLQVEFDPESYEDSAEKVELLEAQLGKLVETTPSVLKDLVLAMQDRLQLFEERGAKRLWPELIDTVENHVKYAQVDFKAERYRPSFENAKQAQKALDQIALNLDERDYDGDLSKQLLRFADSLKGFGPVLDMGSPSLIRLAFGPNGRAQAVSVMSASSPSDLRTAIGDISTSVRLLTPPVTRRDLHQETLDMLELAKTSSANFEKMLILDQYDPDVARDIIQTAYLQMFKANSRKEAIQQKIKNPQIDFKPRGVEQVISYQGF